MKRNLKIIKQRESGLSLSEIGKRFCLSTERVRQICKDPSEGKMGRPKKEISSEILGDTRNHLRTISNLLDQIIHDFKREGGSTRATKFIALKNRVDSIEKKL